MNVVYYIINAIKAFFTYLAAAYHVLKIYKILGIFATRKFKNTDNHHKYAVLVAARNEEAVIGNLIASIRKQDYPSELVDIFVVADNCTDKTAEIAREKGAYCYERFNDKEKTKGYALRFLVEQIKRDYGVEAYEGYFIFDADNLLKKDYISRMNESFDSGQKIITSYRNTKNFGDNFISASYGLHWLRTVRFEHRARSFFHLATRIQGTGFLFANEIIKDGWNYVSLTEDRAFCVDAVANGYQISYNHQAIFYDEQPVDLKIAMRQRIRWAKGHLQALVETSPKLVAHIFFTRGNANKRAIEKGEKPNMAKRIFNNIRLRYMSFDMLTVIFSSSFIGFAKSILSFLLKITVLLGATAAATTPAADTVTFTDRVHDFLSVNIAEKGAFGTAVFWVVFIVFSIIWKYLDTICTAAYVFIVERKRIPPIKWYKKAWYCLTFPLFGIIGTIATVIALFTKVEWKTIPHNKSVTIEELETVKK